MAQINISVDNNLATAVDRLASSKGVSRPELLRQMMQEMIEADDAGRLAFTREEGPKLDLSLSALVAQLREANVELDRTQRENAKIAKRLIDATNAGEEAYRDALEQLTARLVAQRREGNVPFLEQVNQLRSDVAALPDAIGNQVAAHFAPMEKQLGTIAEDAKAPRFIRNLIVGREFVQEWPVMATMSGLWFLSGILILILAGNLVPGLGRSLANQFADNDVALCRQLNNRFGTKECAMPDLRRRSAQIAIDLEDRP
jgi:Ribbon-helix-helix protein, copG family